ncbi:MAG: hypothetical protein EZS28_009514 [Streblomastix strix]|uniref:Uncharacterized protein n=1 Tax=Streblomastix strix TaxID=222440 RepID=A0A5J4WIZ2_9EUKA|nr:MAG: hypothetical protein EZS28_009514 [Streblomastix strix]
MKTMKEKICPLIYLNCPPDINCQQCINVPQYPALIKLKSAVFQTLSSVSMNNKKFKNILVNDHSIILHLTHPLIYIIYDNNNICNVVINTPNALNSLITLTSYKINIHFSQQQDQQSLQVRSISRGCLQYIHEYGDASAQTELINARYARVLVIAISTASGAGEEQDEEIFYRLRHISQFLSNLNKGRPFTFPPQHLLAHRSFEHIEEKGGNEEIESQLINKGFSGNIKNEANKAKGRILNCFIEQGNQRPDCHPIDSTAWEMEQGITSQSIQFTYSINKGEVVVYNMCIFQVSSDLADVCGAKRMNWNYQKMM